MPTPFPVAYTVKSYRGKPAFHADGQPVVLPSYCSCGPGWKDAWTAAHRRFSRHGCKYFWLTLAGGYNGEWGCTPFWTGPGQIHCPPLPMPDDHMGLDLQARTLVDLDPDVRFFIRMMDMPPKSWLEAHPDHVAKPHDGTQLQTPTIASALYLAELSQFLQAVGRYCESRDWADRILGYVIYPLGEGATDLANRGYLFDQSAPMTSAFRAFLRDKYGSDAALRKAWGDDSVTLDNAAVPGDHDHRRLIPDPVPTWIAGRFVRAQRDYFLLQRQLWDRYLRTIVVGFRAAVPATRLCGIDAFKTNMQGWMCHPTFTGKGWNQPYGDSLLATGSAPVASLLEQTGFDLVATPHDYRARGVGFGYDPEGIGDSITLHGKMMLVEEDQRTYANNEKGLFASVEPGHEEAVFYRNLAASLTRGHSTYPMDVCVGYFESDAIQRTLARRREIEEVYLHLDRKDVPGIVMLLDDRSSLYADFSAEFNDLAVIRQRIWGMNHCGVPARTFALDDLKHPSFPRQHRLYLLPNAFHIDAQTASILRNNLFHDGNVVILGPGTGITDGEDVSVRGISELLGLEFELLDGIYPRFVTLDNATHPLAQGAHGWETYGDSHRYGPILLPADAAFASLGSIVLPMGRRRPGLVVREFGKGAAGSGKPGLRGPGDFAVVFTAAMPLPGWLLRNLAAFAGEHLYTTRDDVVVMADNCSVALHTANSGILPIRLPQTSRVTDLVSGKLVGAKVRQLEMDLAGPATVWLRVEPVH